MRYNIHTVFKLRENILFLEDWITYHLSIGCNKFYLYDNSKSIGNNGSTDNINKYGINFKDVTKHLSDVDIENSMTKLLEKYKDNIIYKKWEPRDSKGNIIYNYNAAVKDYILSHSKKKQWTAFIDMDEYLYSHKNMNQILEAYDEGDIGDVIIFQKKFDDRFNNLNKPIPQIVDCIEGIDTRFWAPKHIIKNEKFNLDFSDYWNMHSIPVKNCHTVLANVATLRFNHYNVNERLLTWMKSFYQTTSDFKLNAKCYDIHNIYNNL